jgi:hypothetical protein
LAAFVFTEIYWLSLVRALLAWGIFCAFLLSMHLILKSSIAKKLLGKFLDELFRRVEGVLQRRRVTPYLIAGVALLLPFATYSFFLYRHFCLIQVVPVRGPWGLLNGTTIDGSPRIELSVTIKKQDVAEPEAMSRPQRIAGLSNIYTGAPEKYLSWRVSRLKKDPAIILSGWLKAKTDFDFGEDPDRVLRDYLISIDIKEQDVEPVLQQWKGKPQWVDSERVQKNDTVAFQLWCEGKRLLREEVSASDDLTVVFLGASLQKDEVRMERFDQAVSDCYSAID